MRNWENYLKVENWTSGYLSVAAVLSHYKRRTGSEITKEKVCNAIMSFSKFAKLDPDRLVALNPKEASKLLQQYIDSLADKGQSIRTINVVLAYLKTFFRTNDFKGEKEIEVERYHQPSRYRKRFEYVPSPEEIYRMAHSAGSARNKTMIFALYTSGMRNSTLRALLYKDIKDDLNRTQIVKLPVYPEMKKMDAGACKGNIPYYSFISKEATQELREYLEQREHLYGKIGDDEPLFASTSTNTPLQIRRRTIVKKRSLDEIVKRAALKANIKDWKGVYPHCLRKAFEAALRNASLDPKDQEFLMGHILPGTQDPYYDSSKVEDLRTKYSRINFFKTTESDKIEMIKAFAQTLGIDRIEIKIQKMKDKNGELDEFGALGKVIREELGLQPLETGTTKYRTQKSNKSNNTDCSKYETKIVSESELLPYLNRGWNIVKELKSAKLVIRRNLA